MMRVALAVLGFIAATSVAQAQTPFRGPVLFEQWADRCNNVQREHGLDVAERACTNIIRSDSASSGARAIAYRQRGAIKYEQGDATSALADFSSAVEHDPHFAAAYMSRAALYEAQRDFERAVDDYDQVIRIVPELGPAYVARCWLRTRSGQELETARADCDRAIEMDVGPTAFDTRGLLNLRLSNFEAAWADYDAAVTAAPASAHQRYGRGVAALRLGREEAGHADIAAAAALDETVAAAYQSYGVEP
jgi:tetratricopeptide (TPR) repeat protein